MSAQKKRRAIGWVLLVILLATALVLAGCEVAEPTPVPPVEEPTPLPPDEEPPVDREFEGETVSVLAVWADDELESFRAMVAPWEERTGATIEYEGTRDVVPVLATRIEGGNPPDIAGLPGPGQMLEYARDGHLIDVSTFIDMDALSEVYDESWIELGSYEEGVYGLFTKAAVKSMVWYSPPAFDEMGYQLPADWDEMIALSDEIVADGYTPWCVGMESGAASGWPGTDWIEDIMLRTAGPEVYDQWRLHEIPWTDPAVRNAWELFGVIVTNEDYVHGGTVGVLATDFGESPYPMFQDPRGCFLHKQASFIQDFIAEQFPDLEPVEDYTYFAFPEIEPEFGEPALVAGDMFGMLVDRPASRSLIEWLMSAEAQEIWAARGGFIATNEDVSLDVYPDPLIRQAADILVTAEVVRFDASDLMPAAVNDAFWAGVLDYIQDPGQLDAILQRIDDVAAESYE